MRASTIGSGTPALQKVYTRNFFRRVHWPNPGDGFLGSQRNHIQHVVRRLDHVVQTFRWIRRESHQRLAEAMRPTREIVAHGEKISGA